MKHTLKLAALFLILAVGSAFYSTTIVEAQTPPATVKQGGTGWGGWVSGTIPIGPGTGSTALRFATSSDFTFSTSTLNLNFKYGSTTAFSIGSDFITDINGNGLSLSGAGVLTATLGTTVAANELANADFGSFSCNGTTCTIDSGAVTSTMVDLADLTATDTTLTFSGAYDGQTARTIGLNLGNANTWTAKQTFSAAASSTNFSANFAEFGGTASTTFNTDGKITGNDTTNSWLGRITPTRFPALSTGTTTTWTASTTGTGYSPRLTLPFAGTLRNVVCSLDASFLGVNIQIDGSNIAPSYFIASSTEGTITFTGSNTFTKGQVLSMDVGTTTTATTKNATCTFAATET